MKGPGMYYDSNPTSFLSNKFQQVFPNTSYKGVRQKTVLILPEDEGSRNVL